LSLVFSFVAKVSPTTFSAIAIVSTLNTILAQITMTARVAYGMAQQDDLPRWVGDVHFRTGTPLVATGLVMLAVAALALALPLEPLAESTSLLTLLIFAFVNLALLRVRSRQTRSDTAIVHVPLWIPSLGLVTCILMIGNALIPR
jgi:amino acid transporter